MKFNRWLFLPLAIVAIIYAVKVYAGNLQMTTYYPAPAGFYQSLTVTGTLVLPCYVPNSPTPQTAGQIYISSSATGCLP